MVERDRRARGAPNARAVPTWVPTWEIAGTGDALVAATVTPDRRSALLLGKAEVRLRSGSPVPQQAATDRL